MSAGGGGGQPDDMSTRFGRMNVNADSFVPNVQAPSFIPGGRPGGGGYVPHHYGGYPMHGEYAGIHIVLAVYNLVRIVNRTDIYLTLPHNT
jgi:hypothetical protein